MIARSGGVEEYLCLPGDQTVIIPELGNNHHLQVLAGMVG